MVLIDLAWQWMLILVGLRSEEETKTSISSQWMSDICFFVIWFIGKFMLFMLLLQSFEAPDVFW